jgi:hypothetical protein
VKKSIILMKNKHSSKTNELIYLDFNILGYI